MKALLSATLHLVSHNKGMEQIKTMYCSHCHTRPAESPDRQWCCPSSEWLKDKGTGHRSVTININSGKGMGELLFFYLNSGSFSTVTESLHVTQTVALNLSANICCFIPFMLLESIPAPKEQRQDTGQAGTPVNELPAHPATWTPTKFCLHQGLSQEPSIYRPSTLRTATTTLNRLICCRNIIECWPSKVPACPGCTPTSKSFVQVLHLLCNDCLCILHLIKKCMSYVCHMYVIYIRIHAHIFLVSLAE